VEAVLTPARLTLLEPVSGHLLPRGEPDIGELLDVVEKPAQKHQVARLPDDLGVKHRRIT